MLLKNVFLYPDHVEFQKRREDLSIVKDQTRHIGNYLARNLAKLKYHADGFNRICVIGKSNPREVYLNTSSSLSVGIPFDMDEWKKIEKQDLGDYYLKLFKTGLNECAQVYKLPIDEMFFWLDELKDNNYKNHWTFKERTFRKYGLKCKLECTINLDEFNLRLIVSNKTHEIFNQIILTTPPDEIAFHYKFKDVLIIEDSIIVVGKFETLFKLSIHQLL